MLQSGQMRATGTPLEVPLSLSLSLSLCIYSRLRRWIALVGVRE
jgi:hypothetical protein